MLFKGKRRSRHLDGSFFYPKYGIGMIADRVSEFIGTEQFHLNSRVTQLHHRDHRIERIVVNNTSEIYARSVVNTLPLTISINMLSPTAPQKLIDAAKSIKYRNMILCVFCLDRPFFSPNASVYFPDDEFPFTRLYEPKRRSPHMAPTAQTAIVLEIPCYQEDPVWHMPGEDLRRFVWEALQRVKQISFDEILCFKTVKLPFAYPVLEVGFLEKVRDLVAYLQSFENLRISGRSALFRYLHLHDLFKTGRELVAEIAKDSH